MRVDSDRTCATLSRSSVKSSCRNGNWLSAAHKLKKLSLSSFSVLQTCRVVQKVFNSSPIQVNTCRSTAAQNIRKHTVPNRRLADSFPLTNQKIQTAVSCPFLPGPLSQPFYIKRLKTAIRVKRISSPELREHANHPAGREGRTSESQRPHMPEQRLCQKGPEPQQEGTGNPRFLSNSSPKLQAGT